MYAGNIRLSFAELVLYLSSRTAQAALDLATIRRMVDDRGPGPRQL